MVQQGITRRKG
jgi:hypothetical protein